MSSRTKRRFDDFDPNASDPNDSDFNEEHARPQKRSKKPSSSSKRRPQKRARRGYNSDDVVDDDDELELDESFDEDEESEEDVERNERGRAVRKVTKVNPTNYAESEDEIEETPSESEEELETTRRARRSKPPRRSLVIKLKVNPATTARSTRNKAGSRARTTPAPESAAGTRRSSRLSHEAEQPLMALSDSGNHVLINRGSTRSPETQDMPRRPTRGGKGPVKKLPSAIIEASQEDSQRQTQPDDHDMDVEQEADVEAKIEPGNVVDASQAASDLEPDVTILTSDVRMTEVQESEHGDESEKPAALESDDEDEGPITRGSRNLRSRNPAEATKTTEKPRRRTVEESSDFEPAGEEGKEEEDMSESDESKGKRRRKSSSERSSTRARRYPTRNSQRSRPNTASESELDHEELLEEAEELAMDKARNRRSTRARQPTGITYDTQPSLRSRGKTVDYRVFRPELAAELEEEDHAAAATPSRNKGRNGGGAGWRPLFSTQGPFGGHDGPRPLFGGPEGVGAVGGIDSDSSDDEQQVARPSVGGAVGMTPTSAFRPNLHNNPDPAQAKSGGPANLGKIQDKSALADADPLGVDTNVTFDGVGGLDDHINQLKEMVMLPLLYPELFKNFNVTPPRGVLFHGPPGTGKTLLARALASSVSSGGQKVTFYMRKGADALSKWVGEAERQLRLLFEEARKNQPSIIFFDEIDGLAPVRSSKQEQIHASIVATLLALMDGMDGRGQVIVIGATNRPDSVDPALRRPGRFDREFYFPLPNVPARRAILNIHTKGWEPPLTDQFKDQLAELTKGYGGADLRALCTEAALNAIQGTYPQIYKSNKKYIVDPNAIKVTAKDFMISLNKIVPSSERSAHSSAAPLPKSVEPLLRLPFAELTRIIDEVIPRKKKLTALEEAEFDDREDPAGFEREMMGTEFLRARVFRPRLLVRGLGGMGQQYISSALLNKFEGLFVQSFDIATLLEDSSRSAEAAVVQLFKEVRRHKPSVIYIPNVDVWYRAVPSQAIQMFHSLLQSLRPDESVLLLGMLEDDKEHDPRHDPHNGMIRELFGYTLKNQYHLKRPHEEARREYFGEIVKFVRHAPSQFPDQSNRKRRKLAELELAPEKAPVQPTREDLKAQKKADRLTLNKLKTYIQPVMDQIKQKYRAFRFPVIEEKFISYLYDEQDPSVVTTDLPTEQRVEQGQLRPYEISSDKHGVQGLHERETGKFFYNLDITIIEKRLSNGYYKRPKDYYDDIKRMVKDWSNSGNPEKSIKANELLTNVEVDMAGIEAGQPALVAECDAVYAREKARADKKAKESAAGGSIIPPPVFNVPTDTTNGSGPIILGAPVPGRNALLPATPVRNQNPSGSNLSNGVVPEGVEHPTDTGNDKNRASNSNEDTPMTDSQDHQAQTQPTQHTQGFAASAGGGDTQTQRSQLSAHTHIRPGVDPRDLHNSASTTTSGQKTDRSNRYSNSTNTQSTNGFPSAHHPDFSAMAPPSITSQIPDTQGTYSFESQSDSSANWSPEFPQYGSQQSASQLSQQSSQPGGFAAPALPRQSTSINAILNDTTPQLVVDENQLKHLQQRLTTQSSGMSVEQLEQVNAHLMDAVWRSRQEWNRALVTEKIGQAFNDIVKDIEQIQSILPPSQPDDMHY